MAYKSILTVWDGRDQSRPAMDLAIDLVKAQNGHLDVLCLGVERVHPGLYYGGTGPMAGTESLDAARNEAQNADDTARAILKKSAINWSCQAMVAQIGGISHVVGRAARFNDVVVLARPYGAASGDECAVILESALFAGHAPVIVSPDDRHTVPGKKVIIAWNESAEALAAIKAAMPFLKSADAVDIAIIDPPRHRDDQADPGHDLSTMLARHGIKITVSVLARTMPRVAEVLERHASDFGADLIVMGAYGHSRFRESILGGATRDMLESVSFPVFMAH